MGITVTQNFDGLPSIDLQQCDQEPIHCPGVIQPHGRLLTFSPEGFVRHASHNCESLWNLPVDQLYGRHFSQLFRKPDDEAIALHIRSNNRVPTSLPGPIRPPGADAGHHARIHWSGNLLVLELEPPIPPDVSDAESPSFDELEDASQYLDNLTEWAPFFRNVAELIRKITGYDRVMVYEFDPDGHGEVIAEDKRDDLESFLGLRFPASDIPKQARELYLKQLIRIIPDILYSPVPILPYGGPNAEEPIDLSLATLRGISPIHVVYLRNMGVRATLVLSLVVHDKLWGLIVCHHNTPKLLPIPQRTACRMLARSVSLQIAVRLGEQERKHRCDLDEAIRILGTKISEGAIPTDLDAQCELLRIGEAKGAAIWRYEEWLCMGQTPPTPFLRDLAAWLKGRIREDVYATQCLSKEYPPAAEYADIASGLLVLAVANTPNFLIFWFREEQTRTVHWAGDPEIKAMTPDQATGQLLPRSSFALWKQIVRQESADWSQATCNAVARLRTEILYRESQRSDRLMCELAEAECCYRSIFNSQFQFIAVLAPDGVIFDINETSLNALESRRDQVIGKYFWNLPCLSYAKEIQDQVRNAVVSAADGATQRSEIPYWLDKQNASFLDFSVKPVYNRQGKLLWIIAEGRDITQRKRMEDALRDQRNRLRLLGDNLPDGAIFRLIQPDNHAPPYLEYMSAGIQQIIGLSAEDVIADIRLWQNAIVEEDRELCQNHFANSRADMSVWDCYHRCHTINGDVKWLHLRATPTKLADGRTAWDGVMTDITAVKRIESALRESEERFRAFMDYAPIASWFINEQSTLLYANHVLLKMLGASPEGVIGKPLDEVFPKELTNAHFPANRSAPSGDQSRESIEKFRTPDGQDVYEYIITFPIDCPDPPHRRLIGGIGLDVTELRRTQAQLETARQAADNANQAKSAFLAVMSHEIRTPLTVILGYTAMLQDPRVSLEQRMEAVRIIERSGNHLLQIINNTLDLSQIESGKIELDSALCNPWDPVQDVLALFHARCEQKGVQLIGEAEGMFPVTVVTDPLRLRQILINLVGNAVKFTNAGKITVRLSMSIPRDEDGPPSESPKKQAFLQYEIIDQGEGIEPDKIAHLFTSFHQTDKNVKRVHGGTGLGLAISRELARLLGGDITVTSQPGVGSRFTFSLPVSVSVADDLKVVMIPDRTDLSSTVGRLQTPLSVASSPSRRATLAQGKNLRGRVLIAEDTPEIQRLLAYYLQRIAPNLECDFADNGRDALDAIKLRKYDIAFLDIQMPIMDGDAVMRELRSQNYAAPLIALTANAMSGQKERYLREGFSNYLCKPLEHDKLVAILVQYLQNPDSTPPNSDASDYAVDPEFLSIQAEFRGDLSLIARDIHTHLRNRDFPKLKNCLHRLRGSAAMFGYPEVAEYAQHLEAACKKKPLDPALLNKTLLALEAVITSVTTKRE